MTEKIEAMPNISVVCPCESATVALDSAVYHIKQLGCLGDPINEFPQWLTYGVVCAHRRDFLLSVVLRSKEGLT